MRSAVQTIWRSRTRTRRCRCSAVLPPVSRCVRLSATSRPCAPPEGSGRDLGRFPREREAGESEAGESEAGERAGDNAAPGSPTSARSAGSYGKFPVYQKWGQKQQAGVAFAVKIPERLLPQRKNGGHTSLLRYERHPFRTGRPTSKIAPPKQRERRLPRNWKIRRC